MVLLTLKVKVYGNDANTGPYGYVVEFTVPGPSLLGDITDDGFVGSDDLQLVLLEWGHTPPQFFPMADVTDDGFVGSGDLNPVLNDWGKMVGAGVTGVPEPATIALTLLGLLVILAVRYRKTT